MNNQRGISSLIGIAIVVATAIVVVGGVFGWQYLTTPKDNNQNQQTACTMEAKVCPDGSAVGRTGPNCEFAECPTVQNQTAGWKTYTNTPYGFEFKYPKTWTISDNLTLNTCCLDISNFDPLKKQNERLEKGEVTIEIASYKKSASISLKDFVSSKTYMKSDIKATSVDNVNIAGINGIKSNLIGDGTYYLPRSSIEGISITIFNHPESKENFKEIINQIISTFKFTK